MEREQANEPNQIAKQAMENVYRLMPNALFKRNAIYLACLVSSRLICETILKMHSTVKQLIDNHVYVKRKPFCVCVCLLAIE